jgi:chorismate dehydratase
MQPRVRIGAVSYLNTRPLVEGLSCGAAAERMELSFDVPAVLADRMAAGDLDVALLPSIELARIPDLEIVPGLAIGVRGAARSVHLLCRRHPTEIRRVALDPESRTSNALTRVLCADGWGVRPEFAPGPADLPRASEDADAVVRIGDKALFEPVPAGWTAWDLGEAWWQLTGLPFVFAVWACRPGVLDRELYRALHDARRRGTAAIDRIAREHSWRGREDPERAAGYLREAIRYRLGNAETRGLRTFLAASKRLGLIEAAPEPRFGLARRSACHEVADAMRAEG